MYLCLLSKGSDPIYNQSTAHRLKTCLKNCRDLFLIHHALFTTVVAHQGFTIHLKIPFFFKSNKNQL